MNKLMSGLVLAVFALQVGCSSAPKKVELYSNPTPAVVIVLDDPIASAIGVAKDCEKIVKKIIRLFEGSFTPEQLKTFESMRIEDLVAMLMAAAHIDRISPAAAAEARKVVGVFPSSLREKLFETIGLEEFGTTPLTLKCRKIKTYAIIVWTPGYKAEVKMLNMLKSPEKMSFTLEGK